MAAHGPGDPGLVAFEPAPRAVDLAGSEAALLTDQQEALAVGDVFFQQRCFRRLRELREQGCSLLLVSHAFATIEEMCDRAVLLREGSVA
ncbi:MAG: hypothetical protein AAFY88_20440, partial [Acidobacteriota bacterium]